VQRFVSGMTRSAWTIERVSIYRGKDRLVEWPVRLLIGAPTDCLARWNCRPTLVAVNIRPHAMYRDVEHVIAGHRLPY
jgi:hypothetical protein